MDPRHPELAIPRVKELIAQYDRVLADMRKATTRSRLNELEREGSAVVQEIYLVTPRLHEAMMQASRESRHNLSVAVVEKPVEKQYMDIYEIAEVQTDPAPIKEVEQLKEIYMAPNQAETVVVEPKPRKKRVKK